MPCRSHLIDRTRPEATEDRRVAFTLLESLMAVSVLSIILIVTATVMDSASRVWRQANAKIESFQAARAAFDIVTSKLSQATLNTYWDYYDATFQPYRQAQNPGTFTPSHYGRYSDLHFVCGNASALVNPLPPECSAVSGHAVFFTVPSGQTDSTEYKGVSGMLAATGFFCAFGSDKLTRPNLFNSPAIWRWRLMELTPPTESLEVFLTNSGTNWFTRPLAQGQIRPVAENVIAFALWPRMAPADDPEGDELTTDYSYDSRTGATWSGTPPKQPEQAHQLPPTIQATLVVIDEGSAKRMENADELPAMVTDAVSGLLERDVLRYQRDLDELTKALVDGGVQYRVFSSTVALRESKWSK